MTVETAFENDIFISYAHIDNEPLTEGQEGWISDFHQSLEKLLAQLLGDRPRIWRDPKLQGNDYFADTIVDQFSKVALLVSIFSPRYIKSEWCVRELKGFHTAASQTGGVRVADKARIFKVIKTPVPLERQPEEVQGLLGYEFYQRDRNENPLMFNRIFGSEAEQRYWAKLSDLAYDICQLLEALSRVEVVTPPEVTTQGNGAQTALTEPASASNGKTATIAGSSGIAVYLAETSYDLQDDRDKIKRELQQRGHLVLPDQTLPTYYPDFERVVTENLARCKLSIHLVGSRYGMIPEDAERSLIALQHDLAVAQRRERAEFSRLVWMPVGLQTQDARQQELIRSLQNDPDWLQTGIEALKTVIQDRLTAPTPRLDNGSSDDATVRVYLICDQKDLESVVPVYNHIFFDRGWEPMLPAFEGDEAAVRQEHQDTLCECDAVLIYYGSGNDLWLRTKLRDLQKVAGYGRTKPMLAKAIYVAAPETPKKQMLLSHEAIVLKNFDAFTPAALAPFVDQIAQAQGGQHR
ncbi:DUF4062 domain-containing protein [Stenomitos frigidus]|uniref:DUF4062 domain-containing protein n=1 Tax=Stenomitos frigidus ULC18 TaxID=2107698 RepID=A0A2T1DVT6_9CYAN|nr:DUF4062 domain-containing protein [Stenomitos frigidus]PSB24623.1 hypothetical protein C7B82_26765 [Stenomitos frigidus ULC18]